MKRNIEDRQQKTMKKHGRASDKNGLHEPNSEMHKQLLSQNIEEVKKLLASGDRFCTGEGFNCFIVAHNQFVYTFNESYGLRQLIELDTEGAIQARNENGQNLLMLNCTNYETVQLLITCGANLSDIDIYGATALTHCVKSGNLESLKHLLRFGANVNAVDLSGKSALIYAASNQNILIVNLLLENGADPHIIDKNGENVLMHACANYSCVSKDSQLIISKLLDIPDIDLNLQNINGKTALTYLAIHFKKNHRSQPSIILIIRRFFEKGFNFFVSNCNGNIAFTDIFEVFLTSCIGFVDPFIYELLNVAEKKWETLDEIVKLDFYSFLHLNLECLMFDQSCFGFVFKSPVLNPSMVSTKHYLFNNSRKSMHSKIILQKLQGNGQYQFNTIGAFIMCLQQTKVLICSTVNNFENIVPIRIHEGLKLLVSFGCKFQDDKSEVISPLTVLLSFPYGPAQQELTKFKKKKFLKLARYLVINGVNVGQRLFKFQDPDLQRLSDQFQVPDAIYVAAVMGHFYCIRPLLQYWPAPPLALLAFMEPIGQFDDREMNVQLKELIELLPLLSTGDALPVGSEIYYKVKDCLEKASSHHQGNLSIKQKLIEKINLFNKKHKGVPKLEDLCRVAVRLSLKGGINFPKQIAQLPLPTSLCDSLQFPLRSKSVKPE